MQIINKPISPDHPTIYELPKNKAEPLGTLAGVALLSVGIFFLVVSAHPHFMPHSLRLGNFAVPIAPGLYCIAGAVSLVTGTFLAMSIGITWHQNNLYRKKVEAVRATLKKPQSPQAVAISADT